MRVFAVAPRAAVSGVLLLLMSVVLQTCSAVVFASAIEEVSRAGSMPHALLLLLSGAGALVGVALCSWGLSPVWGAAITTLTQKSVSEALAQAEEREREDDPIASARWIEAASTVSSMRHRDALGAVPEYLAARIRGLSGFVILALVSPLAAVLLAAITIIYGKFFTNMLDDVLSSMDEGGEPAMRARYARGLLFSRSLWGEFRVFDAHRWLLGYVMHHSALGRASSTRQRSRHMWKVVASGAVLMVLYFAVFWWLTNAVLDHSTGIAALMLAFQGSLLLLDLGPIGDTAVLYRQAAETESRFRATQVESRLCMNAMGATSVRHIDHDQRSLEGGKVVSLRQLTFTYPEEKQPAVRIERLDIERGERVALVGRNGAGKSTLLGIMAGYIRGYEGAAEVAPDLAVSVSLQSPAQYPATFRENIEIGRPDADFRQALKELGNEYLLESLSGDDELGSLSFDGKDLSGGQWQRVGLARAVAQRGGVLLLDEPSASLDPKAEAALFQSVMSRDNWDAVVMTTHHLPNVRFVDRIIVLDQGLVVETGSHAELMAADGLYADLFSTQARLYGVSFDE